MSKTVLELQDERALLTEKADGLVELIKTEARKFTEPEEAEFRQITVNISTLTNEIALAEVRTVSEPQIIVTEPIKKTEPKMEERFNLLKEIQKRATGEERSNLVVQIEERANILAGTATAGQEVVTEQKMALLEPLRSALVTVQAGATLLTGLQGDVSIPVYGGTSALWKGEVVTAVDGGGAFSEVTLSPKRLTAFINVSKQFLLQDTLGAEALLMRDIVAAISGKLEATIFGVENVSATQPLGLFYTAPTGAIGTATWANMVAMETAVDTSNALTGNLKYITNSGGRGVLKSTVKAANTGIYLCQNNEVNGYPLLATNHVASALQTGTNEFGIVFGNWADLVIGQWGGFDITVDPYTAAKTGQVIITINAYFDAKVRRAESFKTGSVK